jgi:hypothetical protein
MTNRAPTAPPAIVPPPAVSIGTEDPYTIAARRWLDRIAQAPDGCWLWPGSIGPDGDGLAKVNVGGRYRTIKGHRLIWIALVVPLSADHPLRSVCGRAACVRPHPDHRQPMTWAELAVAGDNPWAQNARKTVCDGGHPLEGEGSDIYVCPTGARECRHCSRQYWRDHYSSAARR